MGSQWCCVGLRSVELTFHKLLKGDPEDVVPKAKKAS